MSLSSLLDSSSHSSSEGSNRHTCRELIDSWTVTDFSRRVSEVGYRVCCYNSLFRYANTYWVAVSQEMMLMRSARGSALLSVPATLTVRAAHVDDDLQGRLLGCQQGRCLPQLLLAPLDKNKAAMWVNILTKRWMLAQLSPSLSSAVHCVGEIGFHRCTQALLNCAASETRFEGVTFFFEGMRFK